MPYSKSLLSQADVIGVMNKALESPKGVMVECESHGAAMQLRQRMNSARSNDRTQSKRIYKDGEPQYGISPYDRLRLRVPKKGERDEHIVYLEKINEEMIEVREIV